MIKDSGTRREFDTGAVRDIQEGKGRCDLLPLDVISGIYGYEFNDPSGHPLLGLALFQATDDVEHLRRTLGTFLQLSDFTSWSDMWLEVSKHFEEGAKKYGEGNWQKGIPTHCYIDSAARHYLKWLRGDTDERHDRAFVWNVLCCMWTVRHKPELDDYKKTE